ncbi:tungsten ABC transporter substrate-binding protein [Malaciobacter pacificus]|uniref:Tungsten ABC transporter TupABC, periplasmic tungstate-binding protein n=1 Tax=Malaciobacter pacificus TaxID=1080223 RepID=A0A5C2H538_9BACT|nr:tungsten ABC transporter TupABC, periplasmic tungstate-binding protein [Malaciobacter pacificus]GGD40532.1 tungsten ABC transporter substrate-binding protein [Malaciobacter pacificus]
MTKTLVTLGLSTLLVTTLMAKDSLMMATTTSTDNTGLLDYLAPKFEKETGTTLKWLATGTGKALKMGSNCDVDILFVHAPASEKKFVESGYGVNRKQVMYNDFIIVGPKTDGAKVSGMTPSEALMKIKSVEAKFFSRGDNSGTNKKEIALWKTALQKAPENAAWYVQTGQGMLRTINMASEKDGYTMTDRGTWIKYESQKRDNNNMKIVVEGDKSLFNQYSVVTINKDKCPNVKPELATQFTNWIVKPETQKIIADFRLLDKALFIPNANK